MESTHNVRRALIKVLSIIGLFVLIALLLWVIVQAIRILPEKFASLANIAQTVNNYRPSRELTIALPKNIVNSGEPFSITWNEMGKGSYVFSYACENEVTISVRTSEGAFRDIPCGETLTLGDEVRGLFISVESEVQRFSDVTLMIAFEPEDEDADPIISENRITVVNATVPQGGTKVADETGKEDEKKEEPKKDTAPAPKPSQPARPAPVVPTYTTVPQVYTYFPVSLPNGEIDLRMTFLSTGIIRNGIFLPQTTFDEDDRVAFQFEVKNIGTKTSERWSYELELPTGEDVDSRSQAALLPQERAVFTVEFDLDTNRRSVTIEGSVDTDRDTNRRNNSFETSVRVTD